MNEEVKEIITALAIATIENNEGVEFSPDVCEKLYNYITNLQKENEELKEQKKKVIEYIWATKYEWGDLDQDNEDFDIDVYKLLELLGGDE